MKIGVTIHATDKTMDPVELGVEAEARGFHSFYLPEHTHIPASRRTPAPTGTPELAEEYYRTLDPYIALAACAARTERIRLGTGIGLVAQHDAITFAKQLATLDLLSQGRLVLGIGFGWNHEEMENHGIDVKRRRELVREKVLAMQALWRDEVASFEGEFVRFEPSFAWPKPVQPGGVPVLIGGAPGPKLFAQIAEYAQGWLPIGGAGMREALDKLRAAFEARQRDPAQIEVVPFGVLPNDEKLAYYASLGVTEAVLRVPAAGRDQALAALDEFRPLIERFAGA